MDIAALSTLVAMKDTGTAVGLAVTKMAMNLSEQSGMQVTEMMKNMELSVNPYRGANVDIKL
ncbi:MAG: putative motility protein [Clostridia bacterium]|jgi:hypothetical protein|nr:putative motility protein [Clostridia bacterium]